jgi:hypothetical protein
MFNQEQSTSFETYQRYLFEPNSLPWSSGFWGCSDMYKERQHAWEQPQQQTYSR